MKRMTLIQWLIQDINSPTYRAGTRTGTRHPKVDERVLGPLGGLGQFLKQKNELEKNPVIGTTGKIRFEGTNLGQLWVMHYSVDIMPELCRLDGREEPRQKQLRGIHAVEEALKDTREAIAAGKERRWIIPYYEKVLEKLNEGEEISKSRDLRIVQDENLFACLKAVVSLETAVWKRAFSSQVLGDSKLFEKKYQKQIISILKGYSPYHEKELDEDLEEVLHQTERIGVDERLLSSHGILSYGQMLEWKGAVQYQIQGGSVIDTSGQIYGTILNAQTLEHAKPVGIPGIKRILVIENKANYEDMAYRSDTLYLYCHGFFSYKEIQFLQQLGKFAKKGTRFFHWGDMDYGGIRIFLFNQAHVFSELEPYLMDRDTYEEACGKYKGAELTENKRKKLERMQAGALEGLKSSILEHGLEFEQEVFLGKKGRSGRIWLTVPKAEPSL